MMFKKNIFFFAIINFSLLIGQNNQVFKGTINKTTKITLYLASLDESTYADSIIGSYYYEGKKDYLLLNGFRNNAGNFSLVELASANFTGTFAGTIINNKMTGKWISADQKKIYNFELVEITGTKSQIIEFEKAILEKGNQFRNY